MEKLCLVTGANRGIGFEIVRQIAGRGHRVLLGSRDRTAGRVAAERLRSEGNDVESIEIDVVDDASVENAAAAVAERASRIDVLINNAGIMLDSVQTPDGLSTKDLRCTLETNLLGPFLTTKAFMPLLAKSTDARVVNISSDLGSMAQASDPNSRYAAVQGTAYRVSKAGLNMLSLAWAKHLSGTSVSVSVCSPGWCRTELDSQIDSSKAPNSAEDGADTAVWLALDMDRSQNGKFYAKRQEIGW